jgi:HlyD family secretion protein
LDNYSVVAPFAGIIASSANLNVGDTVGSGATVATLITKQKVAEISLNEIDAAKVKVGQKVNLTFDAIDNLNVTGTVSEVNLIGTVSQGVVSYTIKISFDTQDDRVKSGMSVSASIITEAKADVLTLPNSAIKTQGASNYVEILDTGSVSPRKKVVGVGASSDTVTEIISGLKEGESVIVKTTIVSTSAAKTASITSLLNGNRSANSGATRPAGGFVRAVGN